MPRGTKGQQGFGAKLMGETEAKYDKTLIIISMVAFSVAALWAVPKLIYFDEYVKIGGEIYDIRAIYYRVAAVVVFTMFIPFTSISYYYSRRRVRKRELLEDFNMMKLDYGYYVGIYSRDNKPMHFFYAAGFASVVSVLGLLAVLLGDELGLDVGPNLLLGGAFAEADGEFFESNGQIVKGNGQIVKGNIVEASRVTTGANGNTTEANGVTTGAIGITADADGVATGANSNTAEADGVTTEANGVATEAKGEAVGADGEPVDQEIVTPSQDIVSLGEVNIDDENSAVQRNSLMFFGIAFLGAYLWGLQQIIIRYFRNDLAPGVYYNLGVRMIFAAIIALLIYQMIHAFGLDPSAEESGFGIGMLPATAFLIGIFPQRAIRYMTERISVFSSAAQPGLNILPLETIQGISVDDKLRLVEEGIDSVNDLANADVVRLLFTTPYTTSQLVDWMLQAKLCVLVGLDIKDLQAQSVRTARDLKLYTEGGSLDLESLSEQTKITKSAIMAAHRSVTNDRAVGMLVELYERVNSFKNLRMRPDDDEESGDEEVKSAEPGGATQAVGKPGAVTPEYSASAANAKQSLEPSGVKGALEAGKREETKQPNPTATKPPNGEVPKARITVTVTE